MPSDDRADAALVRRNGMILAAAMLVTFGGLRLHLAIQPDADFNVGPYNVHHLFTGLLLITAGGVPLALSGAHSRRRTLALVVFGIGLGMALDEWVYLIATDGSNPSYLLPVSLWGAVVVIGLALGYTVILVGCRLIGSGAAGRRRESSREHP